MNDNKMLKIQRMRGYFIDAVNEIIDDEGIEAITARKVSSKAGYNVSTLYNYFDNLDHLLSVSLTEHIGAFIECIIKHSKESDKSYDKYKDIWFEFSEHAFRSPVIYYYIFFKNLDSDVSEVFDAYFSEHKDNWNLLSDEMKKMFSEKNIYKRDILFLESLFPSIDIGLLKHISEINIMVYKSMLQDLQMEKEVENKDLSLRTYREYFIFLTKELKAFD